jgi:hypothetical protein
MQELASRNPAGQNRPMLNAGFQITMISRSDSTLEMYCFCTADPPICAIPAFFANLHRLALKSTSLVFSSICGKINWIGEVAGFSGGVRVLPEEPIIS